MLPGELEAEERDYELGAALGDPRRCRVHGEVTSSPDGMFDAPCGACEAEGDRFARETSQDPRPSDSHLWNRNTHDYTAHDGFQHAGTALDPLRAALAPAPVIIYCGTDFDGIPF